MTFEEALLARVVSSPIGAMLAPWSGTRAVHWDERPEGAPTPAIVFTMIDDGIDYTHDGRDKLHISQIQADTLAETYGAARAIADALGRLLEGAADIGGINFIHGFVDQQRAIPVVGVRGARSMFGRMQRLFIYSKE